MNFRGDATYDGAELIGLVWQLVRQRDFRPDEFVLAGSARLWREGCLSRLSDLDLVAIGSTWDKAWDMALNGEAEFGEGSLNLAKTVRLFGSRVEICNAWLPPHGDPHRLIDEAEQVKGLLYPPLSAVVEYKERIDRPKDRADLAQLRTHLAESFCGRASSQIGQSRADSTAITPIKVMTAPEPRIESRSHQNFQCAMRRTNATSAASDAR